MINFSNYYCLVILLIVRIFTCQTNDSNTTDIEIHESDDVCELPIDEGDCRNESLGSDKDTQSDGEDVINELNDLYEHIDLNKLGESNESSTFYFSYNKSTKKCEQFNFDDCGGNANRFDTMDDCRKTCFTPLKSFLAKVTDLLVVRVTNGTSELPTT